MKISKLTIKNLYGIKEFNSEGSSIELDGKNGVGKSAVIDAIKYALTNKSDREFLIRKGEDEGEVLLELSNGPRIHRKPRTNKADYKSIRTPEDNYTAEKTETFLRAIFTELQLNPVEFASMDAKEQNRIILDLIEFPWDMNWIQEQFGEIPPDVNYDQNILCVLHEIQAEDGHYFMSRQDLNRDARNKTAFVQEIAGALPPDYNAKKWEAADLGEIYSKIEAIRNNNDLIVEANNMVAGRDAKLQAFKDGLEMERQDLHAQEKEAINKIQNQITDYKNKIKEAEAKIVETQNLANAGHKLAESNYNTRVGKLEGELKQYEATAKEKPQEYADLQEEAELVEAMKKHINEYNRMVALTKEVTEIEAQTQDLTAKIEKARVLPGEILATAKIPIKGLSIKDGKALINGLPVSNLSEGEKMELCIDVTVAREGNIKLILIDGIERLATGKRDEVYAKLKEKGVQFIATRTTDDDSLTVVEL